MTDSANPTVAIYELSKFWKTFAPITAWVFGLSPIWVIYQDPYFRHSSDFFFIGIVLLFAGAFYWTEVVGVEIKARTIMIIRRFSEVEVEFSAINRIEVYRYRGSTGMGLKLRSGAKTTFRSLQGTKDSQILTSIIDGCARNGNHTFTRNFTLPDEPESPEADYQLR